MNCLIGRCFGKIPATVLAAIAVTAGTLAAAPAEPLRREGTPTLAPPPGQPTPAVAPQSETPHPEPEPPERGELCSTLRIGESRSAPSVTDPAQGDSPDAPPATTDTTDKDPPADSPSTPGRIQPHNPKPVATDTKKLVTRAYELSQTAKDEQDYTQILEVCEQVMAVAVDEELIAYLNRLMAWAHDRRGQEFSARAAALVAEDKRAQARELEEKALADYDQAVRLDAGRWRAVHNRAVSYAILGRATYGLALRDFTRTIQSKPKFYKAWFNRAELRRELERYDEALADYTQALRLKPDDALAHRGRGHTYYCMGQLRRAADDFAKVVELNPDSPAALADRADLQAELGQWESAARDYQQALRLDKTFGRAYLGAAWLMATCPDQRIRNPSYAVRSAEKAIELDGADDHHYLDTLAAAYASDKMFSEATSAAEQALELAPTEEKEAVKNRLALYEQQQPFRQTVRQVSGSEP